jgi:hypothetical protein
MLEKAMLFLKTEVSSRQEKQLRKILFDLPESVLIINKKLDKILFQNEILQTLFQKIVPRASMNEIIGGQSQSKSLLNLKIFKPLQETL